MIICDIKNAIYNKRMLFTLVLVFFCLIIGGAEVLFGYNEGIDFSYMFFFSLSCGTSSLLALIYPVFACVVYSDTYAIERNSGYLLYKKMKKNKFYYISSKLLSCGISGGFVLSIPVMIYLIICLLKKGTELVDGGMQYITHQVSFYQNNPVVYCLGYVGNAFLCGMIFALMGMAVSVFIKNKYLIVFFPLVIYILFNILFSDILINLNPILWWDINLYNESNSLVVMCIKILMLVIFSIIFAIGVIKDE